MMTNLKQICGETDKIICFDSDASEIDKRNITARPDICFIDGEHTNKKVVSDFGFCQSVMKEDGIIVLHDARVVRHGICEIIGRLERSREKFKRLDMKSSLVAIFFGRSVNLV